MIGNLKYFDERKGFGFIFAEDGKELFFHVSDCNPDLYSRNSRDFYLNKGDRVSFEIAKSDKGPKAIRVTRAEQ